MMVVNKNINTEENGRSVYTLKSYMLYGYAILEEITRQVYGRNILKLPYATYCKERGYESYGSYGRYFLPIGNFSFKTTPFTPGVKGGCLKEANFPYRLKQSCRSCRRTSYHQVNKEDTVFIFESNLP